MPNEYADILISPPPVEPKTPVKKRSISEISTSHEESPQTPPPKQHKWRVDPKKAQRGDNETGLFLTKASPRSKERLEEGRKEGGLPFYSPTSYQKISDAILTMSGRRAKYLRTLQINATEFDVVEFPNSPGPYRSPLKPEIPLSTQTMEFDSGELNPQDLKEIPKKRKTSQNAVQSGQSASEEVYQFLQSLNSDSRMEEGEKLNKLANGSIHWCHIVAYCFKGEASQTQENLLAGPSRFNYTQKDYEIVFRDALLNDSFASMRINGKAEYYEYSKVAKSITLLFTLKNHDNTELKVPLTFDAHVKKKESSIGPKAMTNLLGLFKQPKAKRKLVEQDLAPNPQSPTTTKPTSR